MKALSKQIFLIGLLLSVACQQQESSAPPAMPNTPPPQKTAAASPQTLTGFQTPESVLVDPGQDVYFVSNINGDPTAADDNGFISRVNPDTKQIELKWIDAAKPDILLNAPKGMAVMNGLLYVADLTVVRKFDSKTGAPKGEVAIPGSTFLNDVATDGTSIYVTDSGMKAGPNGFEGTGTDAVWKITNDKPEKIASGKDLNRPNGVIVDKGSVWVNAFGSDELYQIVNGRKSNVQHMPKGSLDGLIAMSDGTFLVSSWDGKAVYRGNNGQYKAVVENAEAPADIGYDAKRHRLLIPHFTQNVVTIHDLQ
ncbi:MAG TPA: hypothetical protein VI391_01955 [Thermoanaerobaculia bacterium]